MKYYQGVLIPIRVASLVVIVGIAIINTNEFVTLQQEKTLHHVFHTFYFVFSIVTVSVFFVEAVDILLQFQDESDSTTMMYWRGFIASMAQSMTITSALLWVGFLIIEISFNSRQVYSEALSTLLSLYILFLALRVNMFLQLPEYQEQKKKKGFVSRTEQLMREEFPLLAQGNSI